MFQSLSKTPKLEYEGGGGAKRPGTRRKLLRRPLSSPFFPRFRKTEIMGTFPHRQNNLSNLFNQFFPLLACKVFFRGSKRWRWRRQGKTPFFPQIGFCQRGDVSIREIVRPSMTAASKSFLWEIARCCCCFLIFLAAALAICHVLTPLDFFVGKVDTGI